MVRKKCNVLERKNNMTISIMQWSIIFFGLSGCFLGIAQIKNVKRINMLEKRLCITEDSYWEESISFFLECIQENKNPEYEEKTAISVLNEMICKKIISAQEGQKYFELWYKKS